MCEIVYRSFYLVSLFLVSALLVLALSVSALLLLALFFPAFFVLALSVRASSVPESSVLALSLPGKGYREFSLLRLLQDFDQRPQLIKNSEFTFQNFQLYVKINTQNID